MGKTGGEPERGNGEEQVCASGDDSVGELPRDIVQDGGLGGKRQQEHAAVEHQDEGMRQEQQGD